jgi:hypothetical protein
MRLQTEIDIITLARRNSSKHELRGRVFAGPALFRCPDVHFFMGGVEIDVHAQTQSPGFPKPGR